MTLKQKYIEAYLKDWKSNKVRLNAERIALVDYLQKSVLSDDTLHFNNEQIENCINFTEKWFFPMRSFQKFLIAFVFLYHDDDTNYYQDFLWLMGRGAGKNGLISALSLFLVSELHGIRNYNGSIIANSEDQAKVSIEEINDVINSKGGALKSAFYSTGSRTKSRITNSTVRYRTSNGNTKDGLRDGFVIFDEIHEYQDDKNVKVHLSGLGKVPNARVFYIGTDGYVRDGFIDKKKAIAKKVLNGEAPPDTMFPWICKLNNRDEVDDMDNWELANPMLSKPLIGYAKSLFRQVEKDYIKLEDEPSGTEEFMTKRMDVPSESMEQSVAPWEEIAATDQPIPDGIDGREAIAATDFSQSRDFIASAVTIKFKGKIVTLEHQWATKAFVDKYYGYSRDPRNAAPNKRLSIPIREWQERGLITIVKESFLDPKLPIEWHKEMRRRFRINKVVMDNFRAVIMRKLYEDAGFEVEVIRNPTSIDGLLATIVDDGFPQKKFVWGDNPLLRWNTNNVLVKIDAKGNKQYLKKEEIRRKTDGFKAFEYTLYRIDDLSDSNLSDSISLISSIDF